MITSWLRPPRIRAFVILAILCAHALGCGSDETLPDTSESQAVVGRDDLAQALYRGILALVEPRTGLPHDRSSISLLDVAPQFTSARTSPFSSAEPRARFDVLLSTADDSRHNGRYGLRFDYDMPASTWGSYNVDAPAFDASQATFLEMWVKGARGGERFEIVLWSNCQAPFPGRPSNAMISAGSSWELRRLALADYRPYVTLSSLCRLSFGFNDAIHPRGTVFVDDVAFVDQSGRRVALPLDEVTSASNIGLYIAAVIGAVELGLQDYEEAVSMLSRTLTSLEKLQKLHGFPQTHNHVVSLKPSAGDTCFAAVDFGNLALALVLLRNRVPELRDRVSCLLDAMEWEWLFDDSVGLLYGCRYADGRASDWHYNWLLADSRLAYFVGIGAGRLPASAWTRLDRSREPQRCATEWNLSPAWNGGGLFMAFMPRLFLDEQQSELEEASQNLLRDQVCYQGVVGAPAWGWSATALPPTGETYCGFGCQQDDVVVPHASLLAADSLTVDEIDQNLRALEQLGARPLVRDGDASFDYGHMASVNWRTGDIAPAQLLIDQSMAFLGLVNAHTGRRLPDIVCRDSIAQRARTLIEDYKTACRSES